MVKIILLHEAVEDIRTKNHRLRYLNLGIREAVEVGTTLDDVVEESQTTSLATQ